MSILDGAIRSWNILEREKYSEMFSEKRTRSVFNRLNEMKRRSDFLFCV